MKDLLNLMKHHLSDKVIDLQASDPHRTRDQELAAFWCGKQTATWAMDLVQKANEAGIINFDERVEYEQAILELNRQLGTLRPE